MECVHEQAQPQRLLRAGRFGKAQLGRAQQAVSVESGTSNYMCGRLTQNPCAQLVQQHGGNHPCMAQGPAAQ